MTQGPTPGTKPLRGTHDLGEIVGYSYRIYGGHFSALFGLALLTVPLQLLIGVVDQRSDSDASDAVINLLFFPSVFVSLIAAAALVHEVHAVTGGERASFGRGLDAAFDRLSGLFSTALLLLGLAAAALFAGPALAVYWLFDRRATIDGRRDWYLALIPLALFAYLAIRWAFNTQAVVIGGKCNWAALDDSADAVRGSWWRVLGIVVVIILIILGPTMLAELGGALPPLAAAAIAAGVSALVWPFAVIAQTLLYYDLKTRSAHQGDHTRPPLEQPTTQAEEAQG